MWLVCNTSHVSYEAQLIWEVIGLIPIGGIDEWMVSKTRRELILLRQNLGMKILI